ncbi:MAG: hypothetical protein U1F42_03735 [Candidatus Competibacteraceae bacterium]
MKILSTTPTLTSAGHAPMDVTPDHQQESRSGLIAILAVLIVLAVGIGVISGYYEGHQNSTTVLMAIPWNPR